MNKKTTLDQEFNDCTKVEILLSNDQQKIKFILKDMYNRLCIFHFEKIKEFKILYDEDEADNINCIQSIKETKGDADMRFFEIKFTFLTKATIHCGEFWYETSY